MRARFVLLAALVFLAFLAGDAGSQLTGGSAPLQLLSPTTNSPVVVAGGEPLYFQFSYTYRCPSAYGFEVFADNNVTNIICSKSVLGLGWQYRFGYTGQIECDQPYTPQTVSDVCGVKAGAADGSYTARVTLFDHYGMPAATDTQPSAVMVRNAKPDLTMGELLLSDNNVQAGEPVTVSSVVSNIGLMDAGRFVVRAYYSSATIPATVFGETAVQSLAVGAQLPVNYTLDTSRLESGSYTIAVKADALNTVDESNEKNNDSWAFLFVYSSPTLRPDLTVPRFYSDKQRYEASETIRLTGEIYNAGVAVQQPFRVSLYLYNLQGSPIRSKILNGIGQGQTKNVGFDVPAADLNHLTTFYLFADSDNTVLEDNENNNTAQLTVEINKAILYREECYDGIDNDLDGLIDEGCLPDLALRPITHLLDAQANPIFPNDVGAFVFNTAPSRVTAPVEHYTLLGEDKNYLNIFVRNSLCLSVHSPNYYFSAMYGYDAERGLGSAAGVENYLEFLDLVGEFKGYSLLINGHPEELPMAYYSVLANEVDWYGEADSGFPLDFVSLRMLNGSFLFSEITNCEQLVQEENYSNNAASAAMVVLGQELCNGVDDDYDLDIDEGCDIAIDSYSFSSTQVLESCPLSVSVTVRNVGDKNSSAVKLGVFSGYPPSGILIGEKTIPALSPGQTFNAEIFGVPEFLGSDTLRLWLYLDHLNQFPEFNEGLGQQYNQNNYAHQDIFIYSEDADLESRDLNVSKETAILGEELNFRARLSNTGYSAVEGVPLSVKERSHRNNTETELGRFYLDFDAQGFPLGSCEVPFAHVLTLPGSWNNAEGNKPATFGEGDPAKFVQHLELYDFRANQTYYVSEIRYFTQAGMCVLVLSDLNGQVGFFRGSCTERREGWLYSTLAAATQPEQHMFDIVGGITLDFSKLNQAYWHPGDIAYYNPPSGPPKMASLPSFNGILFAGSLPSTILERTSPTDYTFTGTYMVPQEEGYYTFKLCLDPENSVEEIEEGDNCQQKQVFVTEKPNFRFDAVRYKWETAADAQTYLRVFVRFFNNGTLPSNDFDISFYAKTVRYVPIGGPPFEGGLSGEGISGREAFLDAGSEVWHCEECEGIPADRAFFNGGGFRAVVNYTHLDTIAEEGLAVGEERVVELGVPAATLQGVSAVKIELDSGEETDEGDESDNEVEMNLTHEFLLGQELCGNGSDDDFDGFVDEFCWELCGNRVDDDLDGLIDEGCGEICFNEIDDDFDGEIDEGCRPYLEELCADNIDNDMDGFVDEDCFEVVEACGNLLDDDLDGLVDEGCAATILNKASDLDSDAVARQYFLELGRGVVEVGETQEIRFMHKSNGPVAGAGIEIKLLGGSPALLITNGQGKAFYEVKEPGTYQVKVTVRRVVVAASFQAKGLSIAQISTVDNVFSFLFGSTRRESLMFIPLLLITSLGVAFLIYNKTEVFWAREVSSSTAQMTQNFARLAVTVAFFFTPIVVFRLKTFNYAIIAIIFELIAVFLVTYYIQSKRRMESIFRL